MEFDWDDNKNLDNMLKHGVSFFEAQRAFFDKNRVLAHDVKHSGIDEQRYFCFGNVNGRIITVRFTVRFNKIRIIGAGYWREGKIRYEQKKSI